MSAEKELSGSFTNHIHTAKSMKSESTVETSGQQNAPSPIDMILHCPACGLQHIDAPDERTPDWKNEPHRSHLCHGCGHIWRPADVPTNGVAAIKTKGKADSPIDPRPVANKSVAQRVPLSDEQVRAASKRHMWLVSEPLRDAYLLGVIDAEQAHGIRGKK